SDLLLAPGGFAEADQMVQPFLTRGTGFHVLFEGPIFRRGEGRFRFQELPESGSRGTGSHYRTSAGFTSDSVSRPTSSRSFLVTRYRTWITAVTVIACAAATSLPLRPSV